MRSLKPGDLVTIQRPYPKSDAPGIRGYKDYPGEYNYHTSLWVEGDSLGVMLESREPFARVLVHNTAVWFESYNICKLPRTTSGDTGTAPE